jgi:hypothetical protein
MTRPGLWGANGPIRGWALNIGPVNSALLPSIIFINSRRFVKKQPRTDVSCARAF